MAWLPNNQRFHLGGGGGWGVGGNRTPWEGSGIGIVRGTVNRADQLAT